MASQPASVREQSRLPALPQPTSGCSSGHPGAGYLPDRQDHGTVSGLIMPVPPCPVGQEVKDDSEVMVTSGLSPGTYCKIG